MRGTWIAISAAHARAHRLYGVRGWLIAVLWLNTLPVVQGGTVLAMQWMHGAVPRVAGVVSAVRLLQVVLPVGLLSAAFMRLRWFAPALFAFGLLQLLWAGYLLWQGRDGDPLALALVGGMEVLIPVMTMAYATWSRRLRVTYRHEVHADDPALAPAGLDRPARGESPTDATEHARERAALRRVAHELTTGGIGQRSHDRVCACAHGGVVPARACASAGWPDPRDRPGRAGGERAGCRRAGVGPAGRASLAAGGHC
jgi:hypothetical protein